MLELIRNALAAVDDHVGRGPTSNGTYRFACLELRVCIAATQKASHLLRMVEHRRVALSAPDPATIHVVEGPCAGLQQLLPPPEHRQKRMVQTTDDYYYYWTPERAGSLTALDRGTRRALVWYPAVGEIASWEFSRPFLAAIHAFTLPTSWTPVHAAAIGRDGRAILIAGRGGVGKTTAALVCAEAGWDYLGDDFVLAGGAPLKAVSMYGSARMREDMFARMPKSMASAVDISTDDGEVRANVDVGEVGKVKTDATEITAIVIPQRAGAAQPAITPIRRVAALSALAGSTLIALAGGRDRTFDKLAELVDRLPCYGFEPGPRLEDIPGALAPLIHLP